MDTNKIFMECVPQPVKVRKFEVDTEALKCLLRTHKKKSNLSNKTIANKLNKPLTLVEHWFRTDGCFAIPDADIWVELKSLLGINDDGFDECVTEFEFRDGVYEKSERCYYDFGISPTITCEGNIKIIKTI